ncbi:MAG TPA: hypothetical protein VHQ20_01830 [Patescibacteria group bacterium]|nr:hypothetical protein [Patescibacteria group bacterium]
MNPNKNNYKFAAAALGLFYCFYFLTTKGDWHFIDNVDLIIHEAGHVVFSLFGQTLYIAGGSLFQIIVPLVFFAYFFLNQNYFSAAAMLYWAGLSTINVSVYAADAVKMQLPLITGDPDTHDWNQLLFNHGLLHYTSLISNIILALGIIFIFVGFVIALYGWNKESNEINYEQ